MIFDVLGASQGPCLVCSKASSRRWDAWRAFSFNSCHATPRPPLRTHAGFSWGNSCNFFPRVRERNVKEICQGRRGSLYANFNAPLRDSRVSLKGGAHSGSNSSVSKGSDLKATDAEYLIRTGAIRKGDLIVHKVYGICKFVRLIQHNKTGMVYIVLEFKGGHTENFLFDSSNKRLQNLILRFAGRQSTGLHKFERGGSKAWKKDVQETSALAAKHAEDLIVMQAQRQASEGLRMDPPCARYKSFEESFPYEETMDQQKAIQHCLRDLQSQLPMDRIICGDVGFGKTEIALRCAMLSACSGFQTAVLVPTTVLAEQHGKTFAERLSPHGVNVATLNRFCARANELNILEGLADGSVDVVVGTHRLLSSDISFSNLGLLIVDEEHRFGVKHKEAIKVVAPFLNVLTLTATPIPRTLYMADLGLRDYSLIETPPKNRLPIDTHVYETEVLSGFKSWDQAQDQRDLAFIRRVLTDELKRGGQCYVVHNRIKRRMNKETMTEEEFGGLQDVADVVQTLLPNAHVELAHGQMDGSELQSVMSRFVNREVDVLVSTLIIENGIDIPTANTMIINRADKLGLAQLHQVRGRIGRNGDSSNCILLLPKVGASSTAVTSEGLERIDAIQNFNDLGSGHQIAARDRDMRGCGELFRAVDNKIVQTGSPKVGWDFYMQLLAEKVRERKGMNEDVDVSAEASDNAEPRLVNEKTQM